MALAIGYEISSDKATIRYRRGTMGVAALVRSISLKVILGLRNRGRKACQIAFEDWKKKLLRKDLPNLD